VNMTFIGIFSGSYCHGDEVASRVARELGYDDVSRSLPEAAASRHKIPLDRVLRSMEGPASLLDAFRRDRNRNVAYLREAIAQRVAGNSAIYHGFATHLLPNTVSHVFKICLVAERSYRIEQAMRLDHVSEKKARKLVHAHDLQRLAWTQYLFDLGPWDERLYDEIVPVSRMSVDEAVALIVSHARKPALARNAVSTGAAQDFHLASQVSIAVAERGHEVDVTSADGIVTMVLNKYVVRVEHLEAELKRIASSVPGVKEARTRLGPKFRPVGIHGELALVGPNRLLLVDDEKEFVHTLSERLEARDLAAAIACDGEDALSFVRGQTPDVIVLDLKMPGIDGLGVLRRVKREHAGVEVIILTGHGSEVEQKTAESLGAFAYLQKPVDIELLASTVRAAYRKVAEGRAELQATEPTDSEA